MSRRVNYLTSRRKPLAAAKVAALVLLLAACSDGPVTLHNNDLAAIQAALMANHPGASGAGKTKIRGQKKNTGT